MIDESQPQTKPNRTRRGCCVVIGSLCLFVVAVALYSLFPSSHRTMYVGATNPATGLHIEYTIGSRFREMPGDPPVPPTLEQSQFGLRVAPAPINWFRRVVLHRKAPSSAVAANAILIWVEKTRAGPHNWLAIGPDGYPLQTVADMREILIESHRLTASDCKAAWTVVDFRNLIKRRVNLYFYTLLIHPDGSDIVYKVSGQSSNIISDADMRSEMYAIRDSIKIVHAVNRK